MKINLPNQITIGRFILAIVFFALLAQYSAADDPPRNWLLNVCIVLFLVAALSDIVDGYLARRYGQETVFGRVIDPFVDKVLICGAYVFFASDGFVDADGVRVSDVAPWMVVVIFGRELLVTGLRGLSESQGQSFAATIHGKIKMLLQSTTAVWIMVRVARPFAWADSSFIVDGLPVMVGLTVTVTALSMLAYLSRSKVLFLARSQPTTGKPDAPDDTRLQSG